jgi:UDP-glucuronate decarboxylase
MVRLRILVTGAAGFLGSHLCDNLILDGHSVIGIDNLQTGRLKNIEHLQSNPHFEFLHHDVTEPIGTLKVDQIYNLACPASPIQYQIDPVKTIKTSFLGAIHVLDLALRNNCPVLQSSTSEVYGDPTIPEQEEEYWGNVNPIGIRACYDEGKRAAETLFFDYHRQFGAKIKVARIFNTYGPRMDPQDGRVVSNFIVQALKHEPISIFGNGSHTRSFCFVEDLIPGLIFLMNSNPTITGPINLGNNQEFSILELAKEVINLTESNSNILYLPLPGDDPQQRKPNLKKAEELLNWRPKIELQDGLRRTIQHFRLLTLN